MSFDRRDRGIFRVPGEEPLTALLAAWKQEETS